MDPTVPAGSGHTILARPEVDRRRLLSIGFGQLGCLFGLLFAGLYLLIGHTWGAGIVIGCTAGFAGILRLSKRGTLDLAGNLYAAVLTLGFTALTAVEGGLRGHAIAWMACVPLCACLFVGPRSGWAWCAVCLLIVSAFGGVACFNVRFPILYPPEWEAVVGAAGYVALTLFMAALGLIFEGGRRRAFQELRVTLDTLAERNDALVRSVEDLRQSEGRFRSLFENSALGVALLNRRGEVEVGNHRLTTLLGTAPGQKVWLAGMVAPAERHTFLQNLRLQQTHSSPRREGHEFHLHLPGRAGPRLFRIFLSGIPETGQVCALLNDITERRATERSIVQLEKSALLDSLVGGIAHELNNKLTPIVGFAEHLLARPDGLLAGGDPETALHCALIRDGAIEAGAIVAQLLQLARPAALHLQPCDLRQVVEQACAVLPFRLREVGCTLNFELPDTPTPILADPAEIKQVILNLALNALDAVEVSPLRVLTVRVAESGAHAVLTLSDTGPGISEEVQARMFEPFFTTKPLGRGTGLGLSVCAGIIKRHQGRITVESQPGEGTAILCHLPLLAPAIFDAARPNAARANGAALLAPPADPDTTVTHNARVLVIDDEEIIAEFVSHVLQTELGCRVEHVGTGEAALQRLEKDGWLDLIISDIRLPGISGLDVLAWIRQRRPQLVPRVLLITGDPGSAQLHAELTTLDVPVLQKPFLTADLVNKCRTLIGGRPATPRSPSVPTVDALSAVPSIGL